MTALVGLVVDSKNPMDAPPPGEERSPERRRSRRAKVARPVRVRPSEPQDAHFEDFPTSVNASSEGVYFLTRNEKYYTGMQVVVTFPYIGPRNPMNSDYVAKVVRVENLGAGKFGVAVELLSAKAAQGDERV